MTPPKASTLGDLATSLVRTAVPVLVGGAATYAATKWHIVLSPSSQTGAIVVVGAVAINGYNTGVRALEHKWPRLGWLLGIAKAPTYVKG